MNAAHQAAPRSDGVPSPARWLLVGGRPASRWLIRRRYDVHVHRAERFPASGPVVVAGNHVGFVDGPLMAIFAPRPVHALTNPIVAWCLFGLTLFVLYFTPLYELSLRNEVVHELVHLHFLVAGSVFFWAVIGLDPVAWRIPYGFRLLLVLLTVPFHAFLGLALMSATTPIAADYYASIVQPLGTDVLADQRVGAGIMWLLGDVIGVVAGVVVVHQWMQHEERAARRADAIDDRRRAMAGTA